MEDGANSHQKPTTFANTIREQTPLLRLTRLKGHGSIMELRVGMQGALGNTMMRIW
ncbi:hypothetical protein IE4771_PB00372 (plasmid) [Rhizobium etli bv. mimosae str. IE4771]|uniref:Uncharacterized protein n=1 Tax=Rhizobium etli bv. mimosae str. IE4771 TaxID=1432050 RepID=A0A060I4X7_RHIET|nr:hypothetical protein IE4771_PB00372 [Rhizobium sp. IE4771]